MSYFVKFSGLKLVTCLGVVLILVSSCNFNSDVKRNIFKADTDTFYNKNSGIKIFYLNSEKIHMLTNLGMLWGFLKYYHAAVSKGEYKMDAELFRILPKMLSANNEAAENEILEQWIDRFGVPDSCRNCREIVKSDSTKLMPNYGYLFDKNNLPQTLINKLEFIKCNRCPRREHYYIETDTEVGNPVFTHELDYGDNPYPDAGIRLVALYRFWNMIQYFYPNRHLIGEDWNKVLTEFIPVFCNAKDTLAYELACLKLIARIHDTHANLWEGHYAIDKMKGNYTVPFTAAFIEGKLVVTGYYADSANIENKIKIGDIIERINGLTVNTLVQSYLPVTPASNYSTQLRDLAKSSGWLLKGSTPQISLQIIRDGQLHLINVERSEKNYFHDDNENVIKRFKILQGNIGYIYPASLGSRDFDSIKNKFNYTKGIIIDMRCYPNDFMPYTYGAWLKPLETPFVSFAKMNVDIPGMFETTDTIENGCIACTHYKGKLVIIVNAATMSQAEFTTMALSTVPGSQVIGDTTAGADGNVSAIKMPGGISTWISGIGVLYPDGTETQRVGVKVDKIVKPTIKGIKERRDEQLEYAIKLINGE